MRKEIGKIQKVSFGCGGYDDAMIGLSVTLGGPAWAVGDFKGWWADHSDRCKWSRQDQLLRWGETCEFLRDILKAAKKNTVDDLQGVPVEVTFDNDRTLKSWRILEEVI